MCINKIKRLWKSAAVSQPSFLGSSSFPGTHLGGKNSEERSCTNAKSAKIENGEIATKNIKSPESSSRYSPHASREGGGGGGGGALLRRKHGTTLLELPICQFPLKGDPSNSPTKDSPARISGTFSTPRYRVTCSSPGVCECVRARVRESPRAAAH